ncbi:MAG TPA: PRC-barrel domain-containing protein [Usitatibacter sp.]|jgi:sporulation protein YlmC with PRC-barrel domain|nr:PRC-barrel domain-containing protein [Usitatibacter sp.]
MKMNPRILLVTICALALSGGAIAQKKDTQQQLQPPMKQASAAPTAGVIPLGVTVTEAGLLTSGYRATKLMNSDVYNDAGQKIGKIGDLVISPSGEVSVAVVDVGGFIGLGKHRVAIPMKQFTQMHPKVILPGANKEALKELPEFVPVG